MMLNWLDMVQTLLIEWAMSAQECVWFVCLCSSVLHPVSPSEAAGTSWSSARVWWAGRSAAACDPAAVSVPAHKHIQTFTPLTDSFMHKEREPAFWTAYYNTIHT